MAIILPEGNLAEILRVSHFTDATNNIATSNAASAVGISFNFSRVNGSSNLVVQGWVPVSGQNSYHSGEYIEIAGIRKYGSTNFISPPGGAGDDEIYGYMSIGGFWSAAELGSSTGTITVNIGHQSRDNSAQRPANYWNPYQRSSRHQNNTTQVTIFEMVDNNFINT